MFVKASTFGRLLGLMSIITTVPVNGTAYSQIITTPNITELCRSAPILTFRRTVVYVDIAAVQNSRPEWGLTILNRLELAPRELLTVIAVNPSTFEIAELFDSCFPSLTHSEMDDARKARGIWQKLLNSD